MKLAVERDVLEVRANASAGAPFRYSGDDDDADESSGGSSSSSVCCIGIEHLLTPACALGVKTCRARCKQAVFSEQARQSPSARYSWEGTALASIAQTRKPALRARILGKLHRDSIRESYCGLSLKYPLTCKIVCILAYLPKKRI